MQLMLDIECYGLSADAAIWEVGYCTWDENADKFEPVQAKSIFVPSGQLFGTQRTADVAWAEENCASYADRAALERNTEPHVLDTEFEEKMCEFISLAEQSAGIWAKGASFDFPRLARMLHYHEADWSWTKSWDKQYKKLRCSRTLAGVVPGIAAGYPAAPKASHSGKMDALAQAEATFWQMRVLDNAIDGIKPNPLAYGKTKYLPSGIQWNYTKPEYAQ